MISLGKGQAVTFVEAAVAAPACRAQWRNVGRGSPPDAVVGSSPTPRSVFSAVRRPSPADLERMRAAYMATFTASDLDAPYAVLFVVARRPPD